MIGRGGFTASFSAQNLMQVSSGQVAGWGISLDTVQVDFVSGSLLRGSLGGQIQIPISDSTLSYHAMVGRDSVGRQVHYEFTIVPRDTINFTIASAKLKLNPTSRIEIGNSSGSFVASATLSGLFDLSGTVGGIPGLGFHGIAFENLVIQSKDPIISPGQWHFASEQHGMAGFPVSITRFNLVTGTRGGMPAAGLQIGLQVDLQPGSNAISGGTVLSGWGTLDMSGGPAKFRFYDIELDSIGVHADLGAVNIQGSLVIYRTDPTYGDGFRGSINANFLHQIEIDATLQMGAVRGFRYWYVDAYLGIASGIAFYPTAAFYGFGGGAWYHMRQTGADPTVSPTSAAGSSTTTGTSRSGYRYTPDDGVMFGFKAIVTIGTYPSSEAFNADVSLSVQILSNGTIGDIRFGGAGYMMASVSNRAQAKVTLNVDIDYDFPSRVFHGVFNVAINANPFTGGGTMVMHFEPSMWYVKIGEPTPVANRVHLNVSSWLAINAYILMGNNIPAPPPLPANVQAQLPGFTIVRNPALAMGDGFAMGAEASITTGRQTFLIFYGEASLDIGFDIAVLHYPSSTTCDGVSGTIGINGWYAQGQIYAYLAASIGLHVDVWVAKGDFEILSVHAAAALVGGAPNPAWVKGAVGGDYSILGGLISGHCYFEFKVGDQCNPVLETPLARTEVVADIQPVSGSRDVSVFVQPAASFNFAVDRQFDITETRADGSTRVRTFRVRVRDFTIERADTHQRLTATMRLGTDATTATLTPVNMLDGFTRYTATVSAYGEEFGTGGWGPALRLDGSSIEESVSTTFTTGAEPDSVPPNQVAYNYPLDRQRYFLKDECRNGVVQLKQGMPGVFAARTGYTASYTARFVPTFGGAQLESPATYNNSTARVEFQIPSTANKAVYALQIIKKETPFQVTHLGGQGAQAVNLGTHSGATAMRPLRSVFALAAKGITMNIAENKLPGITVLPGEKLLYAYWFKTSSYDRLSQKINQLGAGTAVAITPYGNSERLRATYSTGEMFDEYDYYGFTDGFGRWYAPLVRVRASQRSDPWHTSFANNVYDGVTFLRSKGWWMFGQTLFESSMADGSLGYFENSPDAKLADWERGPLPTFATAKSGAVLHGVTSANASHSTSSMSGWTTSGTLMTAPLPGPRIQITYNQPYVVPMDFSHVVTASTIWRTLLIFGGTTSDKTRLTQLSTMPYQLPTHSPYTVGFSYGYFGCQDPDYPSVITNKPFTF
jgi:hypothetical protein